MIQEKRKHKKSKKKPSAMAQVHNRVNAGVMDGVVYGGMMEESKERFETWYRGYKAKYGSDHDHLLWLTDDIDYARCYGNRVEEVILDGDKLNSICVTDLFDCGYDYLDGPDEEGCEEMMSEGYNCYYFEANDDSSYCMCLWDKSAIVSRRELSREEFDSIEGYEGYDNPGYDVDLNEAAEPEDEEYEIGMEEEGGPSNYGHVVEGRKTIYISESQMRSLKKILCESASEREKKFLKIYAVNTYGTTDNFDSAGFILTTGELLNFGNYNEIYRKSHGALDLKGKNFRDFINAGNIRVNPQSPGIEFCDEPTDEQYKEIHKMIKHYLDRGVFYVDCIDSDGKNIWNKEYHGEETNKVTDDIKLFFKNGVSPEDKRNDVLMGYSLSDFLEESKATKHNIDVDYNKYIKSLIDFMREQHLNIDPLPEIELNPEEQDGIFVKTGYYSPDEKKVVVFTDGRHPKDILRTVAHEFVHHMQNLQNPDKDWGTGGDLEEDSRLRSIEGEAFLLGNIIFREWTEKMKKTKELNESRRRIDEIEAEIVEPDDVDLSSFNIKKHLNPKFWDDGHLDTRIRLKLLDIADDFFDSLDVDWVEPVDVIITGSIANYNWNKKYSDIDLHVLVDYEDVDERVDFVREYFTLKKNAWNEKHKNLRIFGFPVEVYVQDANEPHASSGVYSIVKDKWLTEPDLDNLRSGKVDKKHVREMVSTYMNKIDCLVDIYKKHKDDEYEMKKVARDASKMFDEIKKMRKDDLAKYGREMCDGNIIFKSLRRGDYIGKLIKLKDLTYDKINSI